MTSFNEEMTYKLWLYSEEEEKYRKIQEKIIQNF